MALVQETDEVIQASSDNEEKKNSPQSAPKSSEPEEEGEEEGSEEEEEYEIEAIMDAKRGYFEKVSAALRCQHGFLPNLEPTIRAFVLCTRFLGPLWLSRQVERVRSGTQQLGAA